MSESTGYNGWKNYETWLVNTWLTCNNAGAWMFCELMKESDVASRADRLREQVLTHIQVSYYSGVGFDLAMSAFREVDWVQLVSE